MSNRPRRKRRRENYTEPRENEGEYEDADGDGDGAEEDAYEYTNLNDLDVNGTQRKATRFQSKKPKRSKHFAIHENGNESFLENGYVPDEIITTADLQDENEIGNISFATSFDASDEEVEEQTTRSTKSLRSIQHRESGSSRLSSEKQNGVIVHNSDDQEQLNKSEMMNRIRHRKSNTQKASNDYDNYDEIPHLSPGNSTTNNVDNQETEEIHGTVDDADSTDLIENEVIEDDGGSEEPSEYEAGNQEEDEEDPENVDYHEDNDFRPYSKRLRTPRKFYQRTDYTSTRPKGRQYPLRNNNQISLRAGARNRNTRSSSRLTRSQTQTQEPEFLSLSMSPKKSAKSTTEDHAEMDDQSIARRKRYPTRNRHKTHVISDEYADSIDEEVNEEDNHSDHEVNDNSLVIGRYSLRSQSRQSYNDDEIENRSEDAGHNDNNETFDGEAHGDTADSTDQPRRSRRLRKLTQSYPNMVNLNESYDHSRPHTSYSKGAVSAKRKPTFHFRNTNSSMSHRRSTCPSLAHHGDDLNSDSTETEFEKKEGRRILKDLSRIQPINLFESLTQGARTGEHQTSLADIDPISLSTDSKLDWSSVGGLDGHVRALKEMVVLPLLYPDLFTQFSLSPPRGVLFYGPPGYVIT